MMSSPAASRHHKLLVDFHTRHQHKVRFASHDTVVPIRSTLTMIAHKEELWYSAREVNIMSLERRSDAILLARALRSPSDEDLEEADVHVSQAVGLEKMVNPNEAIRSRRIMMYHRLMVLRLQEVTDDDEISRISQRLSSESSSRAQELAKAWVTLDSDLDL